MGRRRFLQVGGSAVAVAALHLGGCESTEVMLAEGSFRIGPAEDFPPDSVTLIDRGPFFVLHDDAGLYAMTAVCTHQQCAVEVGEASLPCPCHGSVFDLDGLVLEGPAELPLEHLELTIDADGFVTVDSSVVVASTDRAPIT